MATGAWTGLGALATNPLRTVLSTLGVVIGVAALVAILALGDGLERFTRAQIEQTTDLQEIVVAPRTTRMIDGISVRVEDVPVFTAADRDHLAAALGGGFTVARTLTGSTRVVPPDSTREVGLLVVATDAPDASGLRAEVATGSFLVPGDSSAILLSAAASAVLFPRSAPVGDSVRFEGRAFRVAGVLAGSADERPLRTWVPITGTTSAWLAAPGRAVTLAVRAARIEDVERGTATIEEWVRSRFAGQEDALSVQSSRARVRQASQAMMVFKLALASIAAVSLLVGGIGIMNVLLASVSERTREIGVRKAAGARSRDIHAQFLAESVAIAGIGSVIGILLGMGLALATAAIIRSLSEAPVSAAFTWQSLAAAAAAAIVIGLVFGTYPARRAARLSPIDAIRHE